MSIEKLEQLDVNSEGASGFKRTFYKEYNLFERFCRNLGNGNATARFSYTKVDYLGISVIGTGTTAAYATIAILASLAILSNLLSIGLTFAAIAIGIGSLLGFGAYRNRVKEKKCIDVVNFIASTGMVDKVHDISDKIADQFSDYLNHCTDQEAYVFARKAHRVMANAIMDHKVKEPMELVSHEYMLKYQKLIPVNKPKFTFANIFKRLKQNIVNAWRGKKKQEQENVQVSVANAGLFSQKPAQIIIAEQKPEPVPVAEIEINAEPLTTPEAIVDDEPLTKPTVFAEYLARSNAPQENRQDEEEPIHHRRHHLHHGRRRRHHRHH